METNLEQGGGYVYQWRVAAILALTYLLDDQHPVSDILHRCITDTIDDVDNIEVEGSFDGSLPPDESGMTTDSGPSRVEQEDIILNGDNSRVFIQVKARGAAGTHWRASDDGFRKALARFCVHAAKPSLGRSRFVFASNRPCNSALYKLCRDAQNLQLNDASLSRLAARLSGKYSPIRAAQDVEMSILQVVLQNLLLVQLPDLSDMPNRIVGRLHELSATSPVNASNILLSKLASVATSRPSKPIRRADLFDWIDGVFSGELSSLVAGTDRQALALLMNRASHLRPSGGKFGTGMGALAKAESLIGVKPGSLTSLEAFVFIATLALCDINGVSEDFRSIDRQLVRDWIKRITSEASIPTRASGTLLGAAADIATIARARDGFSIDDVDLFSGRLGGTTLRIDLLAAMARLGTVLDIDTIDKASIQTSWLAQASLDERVAFWRRAYVSSLDASPDQIKVTIRLPLGATSQLSGYVVEPLIETINSELNLYAKTILMSHSMRVPHVLRYVTEVDEDSIPVSDWQALRRVVDLERAKRSADQIQFGPRQAERLRQALASSSLRSAEDHRAEDRLDEAGAEYSRAGDVLQAGGDVAQARAAFATAALMFKDCGKSELAAQQFLKAARVWMDSGRDHIMAEAHLEEARTLATACGSSHLLAEILRASAWAAYGRLWDREAIEHLNEAWLLLKGLDHTDQTSAIAAKLVSDHVIMASGWGDWETAGDVLDRGLELCVDNANGPRLSILSRSILLAAERSNWEGGEAAYARARPIISSFGAILTRDAQILAGNLHMHYAGFLARFNRWRDATKFYELALELYSEADAQHELAIAVSNQMYYYIQVGESLDRVGLRQDALRIDLYKRTQAENAGGTHESHGIENLHNEKYRAALENLRMAAAHFRLDGWWLAGAEAHKYMSDLLRESKEYSEALLAAMISCDKTRVASSCAALRDHAARDVQESAVRDLLSWPLSMIEKQAFALALRELADVLPGHLLNEAVGRLIELLGQDDGNQAGRESGEHAADALAALAPQLDYQRTGLLLEAVIDELARDQRWGAQDRLLKIMMACYSQRDIRIRRKLYSSSLSACVRMLAVEPVRQRAHESIIQIGRTAPSAVRQRILRLLGPDKSDREYILALSFLGEDISEFDIDSIVIRDLEKAQPRRTDGSAYAMTSFSPSYIPALASKLSSSALDQVTKMLVSLLCSPSVSLGLRSESASVLGKLPRTPTMTTIVVKALLSATNDDLEINSAIRWETETQTNPFSNFRINSGRVEEVQSHSLAALGAIADELSEQDRLTVLRRIRTAAAAPSTMVRTGAARALRARQLIEDDESLRALLILLHDSDPKVRSWAAAAAGGVGTRQPANLYAGDILWRLEVLSGVEQPVEVRMGAAVGFVRLYHTEEMNESMLKTVVSALRRLRGDGSFRVRREVTSVFPLRRPAGGN